MSIFLKGIPRSRATSTAATVGPIPRSREVHMDGWPWRSSTGNSEGTWRPASSFPLRIRNWPRMDGPSCRRIGSSPCSPPSLTLVRRNPFSTLLLTFSIHGMFCGLASVPVQRVCVHHHLNKNCRYLLVPKMLLRLNKLRIVLIRTRIHDVV